MAESQGKPLEEFVGEYILKRLNIDDSEAKSELHLELLEKYSREAEGFLAEEDCIQASEKAWGAASQIIKAVAARRGIELKSRKELHAYVVKLEKESGLFK
ncbi:hypothetical protein KEJ49_05605 [Candidatus Bathyarchaeota archaeon]|nr:hypothetical protein [Candidatus Bathyarchaeota archaeon]